MYFHRFEIVVHLEWNPLKAKESILSYYASISCPSAMDCCWLRDEDTFSPKISVKKWMQRNRLKCEVDLPGYIFRADNYYDARWRCILTDKIIFIYLLVKKEFLDKIQKRI